METFRTTDLYEASLLYAKDSNSFLGIEKGVGREYLFIFKFSESTDLPRQYYARQANIDAKTYADAIRTLKDVIFNRLRAQGL